MFDYARSPCLPQASPRRETPLGRREPTYKTLEVITYWLVGDKSLNWNTDSYKSAMFELMNMSHSVELRIIPDDEYPGSKSFLFDKAGGNTENSRLILLSDKLSITSWSYPEKTNWSLGGIVLHELIYHIHSTGLTEEANDLRSHYDLKMGGRHLPGKSQAPPFRKNK